MYLPENAQKFYDSRLVVAWIDPKTQKTYVQRKRLSDPTDIETYIASRLQYWLRTSYQSVNLNVIKDMITKYNLSLSETNNLFKQSTGIKTFSELWLFRPRFR